MRLGLEEGRDRAEQETERTTFGMLFEDLTCVQAELVWKQTGERREGDFRHLIWSHLSDISRGS